MWTPLYLTSGSFYVGYGVVVIFDASDLVVAVADRNEFRRWSSDYGELIRCVEAINDEELLVSTSKHEKKIIISNLELGLDGISGGLFPSAVGSYGPTTKERLDKIIWKKIG